MFSPFDCGKWFYKIVYIVALTFKYLKSLMIEKEILLLFPPKDGVTFQTSPTDFIINLRET